MAVRWKTAGERAALVFTQFEGVPRVVHVNRALRMHALNMRVPDFLASSLTVLDGEVRRLESTMSDGTVASRYIFEIIDIPVMAGVSLRRKHYAQRMHYGTQMLESWDKGIESLAANDDDDDDFDFDDGDYGTDGDTHGDTDDDKKEGKRTASGSQRRAFRESRVVRHLQEQYAHQIISKHCMAGGSSILFTSADACFGVCVKPLFAVQKVRAIIEQMVPLLCYPVDGLCFTRMQATLRPMHCPDILKWKWTNTIDFLWILETPDALNKYPAAPPLAPELAHFANANSAHVSNEPGRDGETVQTDDDSAASPVFLLLVCDGYIDSLAIFSRQRIPPGSSLTPQDVDNRVVECSAQRSTLLGYGNQQEWMPDSIRHDKTYPNSQFTTSKTILNIVEGIRYEELTCDSDTVFHQDYVSPLLTGTSSSAAS